MKNITRYLLVAGFAFLCSCTLAEDEATTGTQTAASPRPAVSAPVPVLQASRITKLPDKVYVRKGMHRQQIQDLLGEPEFESLIPALRRVKATYRDSTVVTYVNNLVVMVQTGQDFTVDRDGAVYFKRDESTIHIAKELFVPSNAQVEDQRAHLKRPRCWYLESQPYYPLYEGMRFVPACPIPLLDPPLISFE